MTPDLQSGGITTIRLPHVEQNTGFEPVLSVWKTDVLTTNTNSACWIKQAALALQLYVTPHNHLSVQPTKIF